jgi:hypothetical protein
MTALYALLGLAGALLLVRWNWHRHLVFKSRRRAKTAMSVASRAPSLSECPPEFHARLRAAMHLEESPL